MALKCRHRQLLMQVNRLRLKLLMLISDLILSVVIVMWPAEQFIIYRTDRAHVNKELAKQSQCLLYTYAFPMAARIEVQNILLNCSLSCDSICSFAWAMYSRPLKHFSIYDKWVKLKSVAKPGVSKWGG
jgi:hypothetical protein